jgi:hypothetical protein
MQHREPVARRLYDLTEPISLVNFFSEEPNDSMAALGGTEAHVLSALEMGIHPAESFGRIHHLPRARLAAVMGGLRDRGLVDASGHLTGAGRATKERIEALTDALAEAPYTGLDEGELGELVIALEPISTRLRATGSR